MLQAPATLIQKGIIVVVDKKNNAIRGDTLIEVLFAVAIFSLVAVSSMSIMNQGTATAQRALEITLVRQEIDAQAEALRFLNASYISNGLAYDEWKKIHDELAIDGSDGIGNVTEFGSGSDCSIPNNSFILDTHNAKVESEKPNPAETFSKIIYRAPPDQAIFDRAEGIWIEALKDDNKNRDYQKNAGYIDFHIRACWYSAGQAVPVTIGTIVRLYAPV